MNITKEKIALIQKILNARLTKEELSLVKGKAQELIDSRNTRK